MKVYVCKEEAGPEGFNIKLVTSSRKKAEEWLEAQFDEDYTYSFTSYDVVE